jgi:hypothetical protein
MRKPILVLILSILTITVLFSPFFLPDEWIYIKHNESVYHPFAETLMSISTFLFALFAGHGIGSFFDTILND